MTVIRQSGRWTGPKAQILGKKKRINILIYVWKKIELKNIFHELYLDSGYFI